MVRMLVVLTFLLSLFGCASESAQFSAGHVNFVLGNELTSYDIKLARGTIDKGVFIEDWFSPLSYQMTKDQRYIIGSAEPGTIIAITSTKANDASGHHFGTLPNVQ